jgi:hypothetical protein
MMQEPSDFQTLCLNSARVSNHFCFNFAWSTSLAPQKMKRVYEMPVRSSIRSLSRVKDTLQENASPLKAGGGGRLQI